MLVVPFFTDLVDDSAGWKVRAYLPYKLRIGCRYHSYFLPKLPGAILSDPGRCNYREKFFLTRLLADAGHAGE